MKKTLFILAVVSVSSYLTYTANSQKSEGYNIFTLSDVEAISACEISPDHSQNIYYCSKLAGTTQGSCVETGSGAEPRCSGNI